MKFKFNQNCTSKAAWRLVCDTARPTRKVSKGDKRAEYIGVVFKEDFETSKTKRNKPEISVCLFSFDPGSQGVNESHDVRTEKQAALPHFTPLP